MKRILLLAVMIGCLVGCSHGTVHWVQGSYLDYVDNRLVCDSSGKTVAEIMHVGGGSYDVFGGNGEAYGEYETQQEAEQEAASLVTNGLSIRMGAKWLTCN